MVPIRILPAQPNPDTMPVIKTTEYPWTEGSFRPLMYVRAAYVTGRGIFLDLMAFERQPQRAPGLLDGSCVAASLCFGAGPVLTVAADADGRCALFRDGAPFGETTATHYAGDDEQGWYWGVRFYLEDAVLGQVGAPVPLCGGETFSVNFYKMLRAGEYSHLGAAAPMTAPFLFARENLAPAQAVAY